MIPLALILMIAFDQAPPPRLLGEQMELATPTGTLRGTLDLPTGPGPWPVVLLHPGSGPTDRDGNGLIGLKTNCYKQLGRALAAHGTAVVRIDKRGIAGSAKAMVKETDLRLDTYAADVAAWVAFLRKDPRFTKVGFIGHSEGSLIGLVATKSTKFDAFVSLCGPGRPLPDILREQLKEGLPNNPKLYETCLKILTELEAGRTVSDTPKELAALFRASVQPYLISTFKHDPVDLLKAYTGPFLVVSGTTDIQVPVSDGNRLAAAKPGVKHVAIDGMNHILKAVPKTDRAIQIPTYNDPQLPLHPKLVESLVEFFRVLQRK